MWRDDAYLLDMLLAARDVQEYTHGVDWARFAQDDILQNAVMHRIQVISEAARRVSPEFRQADPEIPWSEVIGMRHRLVHDYFRIVPDKVWEVVERDIGPPGQSAGASRAA